MIRTFIAVEIPQEIKEIIADFQKSLAEERFPIRWVKPDNIHLTLKFIGEIPESVIAEIEQNIFHAPPICEPFEITISGTGVFPYMRKPRVFWLGITNGTEELVGLAQLVEEKLVPFNIKKEKRKFRSHLTIGRFKKAARVTGLGRFLSPDILYAGTFKVREIILMKSVLKPSGAEYSRIAVHSLSNEKP